MRVKLYRWYCACTCYSVYHTRFALNEHQNIASGLNSIVLMYFYFSLFPSHLLPSTVLPPSSPPPLSVSICLSFAWQSSRFSSFTYQPPLSPIVITERKMHGKIAFINMWYDSIATAFSPFRYFVGNIICSGKYILFIIFMRIHKLFRKIK